MSKTKIAIACQGGGSHTAFTAGVLRHLLAERIHDRYDLIGLTGTSGGAVCATAVLYGLAKEATGSNEPPYKVLTDFWRANTARTPVEKMFATMTGFYLGSWLRDLGMLGTLRVAGRVQRLVIDGTIGTEIARTVRLNDAIGGLTQYTKRMTDGKVLISPHATET